MRLAYTEEGVGRKAGLIGQDAGGGTTEMARRDAGAMVLSLGDGLRLGRLQRQHDHELAALAD